ncbi:cell division protein SepF [Bacillus spongiae]|uniref:Cell division protein SepF n=1 Tax=Bacillus spongiae TaxID=2683610 RepID=A0ABU8HA04_9BACI
MGLKTNLKKFFFLDEEDYVEEQEENTSSQIETMHTPQNTQSKQNVVSLQSVQKASKMVLVEPRIYAEAQEVADHLKNRRGVVVNLQRISHDQAKRIVDFLSGTVYAIGGDIQRIGTNIFLCTPDNYEVSGNITEILKEEAQQESRW